MQSFVKTMGHLMQSGAVGQDMKKAYTYALRLDDDLYQQSLEAERTKIQKAEDKRRQEAIAKAKKVPTRRSSNPPAGSIQATDLDGVIGQTLDKTVTSKVNFNQLRSVERWRVQTHRLLKL